MLTLDQLRATLAECGCCPPPGCCPPLVECRSGFAQANSIGFVDPAFSDSSLLFSRQTRYLRRRFGRAGVSPDDVISDYPTGSDSYTSFSRTVTWSHYVVDEFTQGFAASVAGAYFAGGCGPDMSTTAEESRACEITGGWTDLTYYPYFSGGSWHNYLGLQQVFAMSDAEGEETEAHIAWEVEAAAWDAAHPDYPAEVAAYEAAHLIWQAASDAYGVTYAAWAEAWNAWDAGGQIGEEPVEPEPFTDPEPTIDPPRPAEPDEFYGPCTQKTVEVGTIWDLEGDDVVLRESTPEAPNPYTIVSYSLGSGGAGDIPFEDWETLYETPVTFEDFLTLAEAWIATKATFEHASDSGSDACPPGETCRASKAIGASFDAWQSAVEIDFFQYRFKLDKCCGYIDIRSEWDTIFYPQEWLDWQEATAALGSSDEPLPEPSRPVKNPRAWTWTGTPPLCNDSSGSSDSTLTNHYDHEPMWSPWSATIMVPAGDYQGIVVNRNYQQKCYEAPPEEFPDLFGTYEDSSS